MGRLWLAPLAAILSIVVDTGLATVLCAQTAGKPPAQVITMSDVRKQAEACERYAQVLDKATAALRSGDMTTDTGEIIRRHKAVVDPICTKQDAPSAGRNLAMVLERTADIAALLP